MADTNAVGGLKWVKDEIVASLRRVRVRLEESVERGPDAEQSHLDEAVTALGEVRGVLTALQLIGPARLTDEMQRLFEDLVAESVSDTKEASEALMLALIQLPDYLDKIGPGQADTPLALLPSINDLRASRGAARLTEAELLVPTSLLAESEMLPPDDHAALREIASKVRPRFHMYLLRWLRGEAPHQGLADLGTLFQQLQHYIGQGIFRDVFLVAEEVVKGLLDGEITADTKSKALIAHLDQIIKPFATDPRAWPRAQAQALLFELLSSVSHCKSPSHRADELLKSFGFDQEAGGTWKRSAPTAMGPGPEAFRMLVVEARKELAPIKDALDLFARGDRGDPGQLLQLGPKLRNLANTLAVTGADDLVGRLQRCADDLEAMGRGGMPTDDLTLTTLAEELLSLEVAFGGLGFEDRPEAGREEARALVVDTLSEIQVDIAKAERVINALVDTPGDHRALQRVPELFRRVTGALRVLAEDDAARVLGLVVEQIEERFLKAPRAPAESELDLLAQAISGVDLYMAGMSEGEPYRADLLAEAHRAVEELRLLPLPSPARTVDQPQREGEGAGPSPDEIEARGPATASGIDPDFLDIFLDEAKEEERAIREQFDLWRRDEDDDTALATLRRSFHTLKGSGRLVGALRVGELARAVEMLLNRVIDRTLSTTPEVMDFVAEAVGVLPDLIAAETQQLPLDVSDLIARAEALSMSTPEAATASPADEPKAGKVIPWPATPRPPVSGKAPEEQASHDSVPAPGPEVDEIGADARAAEEDDTEVAALMMADDELLEIFRTEAQEHLNVLRAFVMEQEAEGAEAIPDEPVVRALHTLTGSARMTGVQSTANVTAPLERLFLAHQSQGMALDSSLVQLLGQLIAAFEKRLEHLQDYGDEMAALRGIAGDLQARVVALAQETSDTAVTVEAPELSPQQAEEDVPDRLTPEVTEEVITEEEDILPGLMDGLAFDEDIASPEVADVAEDALFEEHPSAPARTEERSDQVPLAAGLVDDEVTAAAAADRVPLPQDPELVSLFLEDARDMVDRLDRSLRELQLAPTASGPLEEMQRSLHTLKGSARLSGLTPIGDLSHAFESLLTAIAHGEARMADDTLGLAQRTLDTLSDQIDAVEKRADLRCSDDLVHALALALEEGLAGPPSMEPGVAVMLPSPATAGGPETEAAHGYPATAATTPSTAGVFAELATPQIRVRSDLIDRLVNNAGEISIYRSRLAQQGGLMTFRLGELERTVDRLRGQLRHLEMETEAQILHRYERDTESLAPGREGFDPLELDRFSTLQQLSRSLAETVNDLVSLRTLLRDLQSESDTLLQQQARISNDLQDGLLRTRMVPFAQMVPRLHRVVRQTARQTGKEARLEVLGPEVELDRSIQERLLAPLEHLLRNAVAHGIEAPEQRIREGKAASGVVSLVLNREGNDVVITVADDGAGLDLEAIRHRALEQGLIPESAEPGDEKLTALILESGFTTVDKVSQIAGRGVGLDVVNTEVRQLSGTFSLETRQGRGTSFSIRLPLTLAIIEALLVQLGSQIFAIPHATVEAASRISRTDLEACYKGEGTDFTYGGHDFRVMYLGTMLQLSGVPDLGERRWLPVLLARSGEERIAFHVEQLLGSQRIVVKPLGPELSNIRWLSGGTILPDGRVAMILDLLALLRTAALQDYRPPMQPQPQEVKRRPCVMVVDDSLTVRRVTSRMLQRQNMEVITAQDGIDALTRLEERVPDVMLLDIEMPRMDGYELTRHIRRSERLKGIPLIMITSRTGEKHRRHALELGVDRYLGKPYQETDLLDEISSVLVEASL